MPKNGVGKSIVFLIVGFCPLILGVILIYILDNDNIEMPVLTGCTLLGGLLDTFILEKEYNTKVKDNTQKIKFKILFIFIIFSITYSVTAGILFNNESYSDFFGEKNSISFGEWIGVAIFAPIGEELIYRFAIFGSLNYNNRKFVSASIISAFMFMISHLNGDLLRNFDLFVFGFVSALIFHLSHNLLYCIIFHSVSNIVTSCMILMFQRIHVSYMIVAVSLPILILTMVILAFDRKNNTLILGKT